MSITAGQLEGSRFTAEVASWVAGVQVSRSSWAASTVTSIISVAGPGAYARSWQLSEAILARCWRKLGHDHLDTLRSAAKLAFVLRPA